MWATLQYCTLYGIMAVAVTPNLMLAAVLSSGFYSMWNLFAGFIIPKPVCCSPAPAPAPAPAVVLGCCLYLHVRAPFSEGAGWLLILIDCCVTRALILASVHSSQSSSNCCHAPKTAAGWT